MKIADGSHENIFQRGERHPRSDDTQELAMRSENRRGQGYRDGLGRLVRRLFILHMDPASVAHLHKPILSAIVLADSLHVRRGQGPAVPVSEDKPLVHGIDSFEGGEIPVDRILVVTLEDGGLRQDLHVRVPFEQEQIELIGDVGGRQRQRVTSGRDQPGLRLVKRNTADRERHERHDDNQDRQPGIWGRPSGLHCQASPSAYVLSAASIPAPGATLHRWRWKISSSADSSATTCC